MALIEVQSWKRPESWVWEISGKKEKKKRWKLFLRWWLDREPWQHASLKQTPTAKSERTRVREVTNESEGGKKKTRTAEKQLWGSAQLQLLHNQKQDDVLLSGSPLGISTSTGHTHTHTRSQMIEFQFRVQFRFFSKDSLWGFVCVCLCVYPCRQVFVNHIGANLLSRGARCVHTHTHTHSEGGRCVSSSRDSARHSVSLVCCFISCLSSSFSLPRPPSCKFSSLINT